MELDTSQAGFAGASIWPCLWCCRDGLDIAGGESCWTRLLGLGWVGLLAGRVGLLMQGEGRGKGGGRDGGGRGKGEEGRRGAGEALAVGTTGSWAAGWQRDIIMLLSSLRDADRHHY